MLNILKCISFTQFFLPKHVVEVAAHSISPDQIQHGHPSS